MINLNKYALDDSQFSTWGAILGDISEQDDLTALLETNDAALKVWIQAQGYVNDTELDAKGYASLPTVKAWIDAQGYIDASGLAEYAKKTDIPTVPTKTSELTNDSDFVTLLTVDNKLANYAKKTDIPEVPTKVSELTNDSNFIADKQTKTVTLADVNLTGALDANQIRVQGNDVATQVWVEAKNYLTEHQSLKTVNGNSLVGTGDIVIEGGLSDEEKATLNPELHPANGILHTTKIPNLTLKKMNWVCQSNFTNYLTQADDEIYNLDGNKLYKFNPDTLDFDFVVSLSMSGSNYPIWKDHSGRYYWGNSYTIDMTTGNVESISMGGIYTYNSGTIDNIFKTDNHIYMLCGTSECYIFNEDTRTFTTFPITNPMSSWGNEYYFKYGDKHLFIDGSNMYELHEYDDRIEITLVESPYFTICSGQVGSRYHNSDSGLYMFYFGSNKKLVDGTWTDVTLSNPDSLTMFFFGLGAHYGNLLIGENMQPTILNLGSDIVKKQWVSNIGFAGAVDLSSAQTITGDKTFSGSTIFSNVLNANSNINLSGNLNLNGTSTSIVNNSGDVNVTTSGNLKVNSSPVALKGDLFVNKTSDLYGSTYHTVTSMQMTFDPQYYWYSPSGRLFVSMGATYEFNGTEWVYVTTSLGDNVQGNFVVMCNGHTFFNMNSNTYEWNDTANDWELKCSCPFGADRGLVWSCGDTIRYDSTYKLNISDDGYAWIEDAISTWYGGKWMTVGSNVYHFYENTIYQYNESDKSYTQVGTTSNCAYNYGTMFVFNGEIFYFNWDSYIYKATIDYNADEKMKWGYYNMGNSFYGNYNGKLYAVNTNSSQFGYFEDTNYNATEVPNDGQTYVLKAVNNGGVVTYSWVLDNTTEIENITNEILA